MKGLDPGLGQPFPYWASRCVAVNRRGRASIASTRKSSAKHFIEENEMYQQDSTRRKPAGCWLGYSRGGGPRRLRIQTQPQASSGSSAAAPTAASGGAAARPGRRASAERAGCRGPADAAPRSRFADALRRRRLGAGHQVRRRSSPREPEHQGQAARIRPTAR